MLKAGIYVDAENIRINDGFRMSYLRLRDFVASAGYEVIRANVYLARDRDTEERDEYVRLKREGFRRNLRRYGYRVVTKDVKVYVDVDSQRSFFKANTDTELALDCLIQARNLDRVVLLSGDSDFTRLVLALQNLGCRTDVLAFCNYGRELVESADYFHNGYLLEGLLPLEEGSTHRGFLRSWNENGYGFFSRWDDLNAPGVFVHVSQFLSAVANDTMLPVLINNEHHVFEYAIEQVIDRGPDGRDVEKLRAARVTLVATTDHRLRPSLRQYVPRPGVAVP